MSENTAYFYFYCICSMMSLSPNIDEHERKAGTTMKVLVYGGTGSQGGAVVRTLLKQGHEAKILTRSPEKAVEMAALGAEVAIGDMNDLTNLQKASEGIDAVALTITFVVADCEQAFSYARNAIDAAKAAGVKLVVYNTSGPVLPERIGNPGYDVRHEVIHYLKGSELPYIVLQPTLYLENLLGPWTLPGLIENDRLAYPIAADQPVGWLATEDLASLMVAALERPELAPAHFVISGEKNVTGEELAAHFSQALSRQITYQPLSLEAFAVTIERLFGPGAGEGVLPGYRYLQQYPERVTNWTDMSLVLDKLPVQMTSIIEWAKQVAPLLTRQPSASTPVI
jgi:uncharacterized protein YbjT (DUF2867 family)